MKTNIRLITPRLITVKSFVKIRLPGSEAFSFVSDFTDFVKYALASIGSQLCPEPCKTNNPSKVTSDRTIHSEYIYPINRTRWWCTISNCQGQYICNLHVFIVTTSHHGKPTLGRVIKTGPCHVAKHTFNYKPCSTVEFSFPVPLSVSAILDTGTTKKRQSISVTC